MPPQTDDGTESWIEWQEIVEYANTQGYNAVHESFMQLKRKIKNIFRLIKSKKK